MTDVYKIGVAIAMTDNATQVIQKLSQSLIGINLRVKDLQGGLDRVKLGAIGLSGVLGGAAVLSGMVKLVEHGKEFVHQQSLMAQAGISQADIAQGTASAWKTAGDVIGSSAEKNIALVADLRNRLGSMKEAIAAMPAMSRLGVFLQNGTGQDQEKAGDTAARFLELKGALVDPITHQISEARMEQQAKLLEAIAIGTRFKVGPDQLLGFQSYARAAGSSLSDQGLINLAPVIAASKSASTVGTQVSSMDQQLLGGIMTSAGATFLEKLNLMDQNKVHNGKGGHLTLDPGALIDGDMLRTDPVGWIHKYLGGSLLKQGAVTADQQVAAVMGSHLRSTVVGLLAEVLRSYPAFTKDAANITQARGTDQYAVSQATDPTARLNAFNTAWHNLLTSLGAPIVNDATGMLGGMTRALNGLSGWASGHPRTVETIEAVAAGLAALAVVGGSLAIAGAAFGPFVAGLSLLTGVIATSGTASAAGLVGISTGLRALSAAIPVVGAAIAGWYAGQAIREHTNIDGWLDGKLKDLGSKFASMGLAGKVPEFATPEMAARAARQHTAGLFSPVPVQSQPPLPLPYHGSPGQSPRGQSTADGQAVDLHVHNYIDGHQVSESVERRILRAMRPAVQVGTNDFDGRAAPMPAGVRY